MYLVNSLSELKSTLNLKTISVGWDEPLPVDEIKFMYTDTQIAKSVNSFCDSITRLGSTYTRFNRANRLKFSVIADQNDIIMAYLVTSPVSVEIFFHEKIDTTDWLSQFKPYCTRRQFFGLVKSMKNMVEYESRFELSQYCQLISPHMPDGYSARVSKLNNDYILVRYNHDILPPILKVLKLSSNEFEWIVPELSYNPDVFDGITLSVEGKQFKGSCFNRLYDGTSDSKLNKIEFSYKGVRYSLSQELKIIEEFYDDNTKVYDLPKFRESSNLSLISIMDSRPHEEPIAILSNGMLWYLHSHMFIDLREFEVFKSMNLDLFSCSSMSRGVFFSKEIDSLERIPVPSFVAYLSKRI